MQIIWRKSIIGRGNSKDKGPEERARAACATNSKKSSVT